MASIFKELKPLMNATFEASQSINRTAPILACAQVLQTLLLAGVFISLLALLVTLNPDLEEERRQFVTPTVRFLLRGSVNLGLLGKSPRRPAAEAAQTGTFRQDDGRRAGEKPASSVLHDKED